MLLNEGLNIDRKLRLMFFWELAGYYFDDKTFATMNCVCTASLKTHPNKVIARYDVRLVKMVGRARFELATNGLKVRCSTD
jgi:hypothetical protein